MRWRSCLSRSASLAQAIEECAKQLQDPAGPPDIAFVFVSSSHRGRFSELPALIVSTLDARHVLGCSGGGVVGQGREIEHAPAVSVTAAWLPGVEVRTFGLQENDIPDMDAPPERWHAWLRVGPRRDTQFIVLADPFSFPVEEAVIGLDYAYPGCPKVGGLASDAPFPGGNALLCDNYLLRSGLVGVALSGNLRMEAVVAQGCRPVGQPMVITGAERNHVTQLNRREPLEVLRSLVQGMTPQDRDLAGHSLFLGIQMDPFKQECERGDFLIRNLIGIDHRKGNLVVAAAPRVGQTVQFHLRDARTSAEDLELLLKRHRLGHPEGPPAGALLFSCLGRGDYLYGEPDHDSRMLQTVMGDVPLGGFFCNGEIGPVGGTTYLHGYTSCFALFRPA
ncbi:MAG: FIST N-terminal domain-containing protein [Candidatus Eremiobacterota bacterium]